MALMAELMLQAFVRASRMGARVPAWACRLGAGRPVGPGVGGACLFGGQLFKGAGFWEAMAG